MSNYHDLYWGYYWTEGFWAHHWWPDIEASEEQLLIGGYPFPVEIIKKLYEKYVARRKKLSPTPLITEKQTAISSTEIIGVGTPKPFLADLSRYDDIVKDLKKVTEEKPIEGALSDRLDRIALLLYQRINESEEIVLLLLM